MVSKRTRLCAVVVNDYGDILPYTCQSSKDSCEEHCQELFPDWEKLKELGCKIVQAELTLLVDP